MPQFSGLLRQRVAGALLMAVGVFALAAPVAAGEWSLAILGIPLIVLSVAEAYSAFTSPRRADASAYVPCLLALLAGNLLLLSSALVVSGLLILLVAILLIDGFGKILTVWRKPLAVRIPTLANGLVDLGCAALLWYLNQTIGTERAIGIVVGAYILAAGWRMLMAPVADATPAAVGALSAHPDRELGLPPNETFGRLRAEADATSQTVRAADLMWMSTLAAVFLAIHLGRMPISDSLLGISSPFIATAGDILMTLVLAALLVLPARLLWRRLTRPLERLAWSIRFGAQRGTAPMNRAADWVIGRWLESRLRFAMRLHEGRTSLAAALILVLRLGLPVTAFFVAFNPIWGFTWYFNTESWATGVYLKMTQLRVDPWRAAMTDAVTRAYGGGDDKLFRVDPGGLQGGADFSFLVIGDPGEGDASQYSLVSRYLDLGHRDDVKFLVVSSDVIYPAGSMHDSQFLSSIPGVRQADLCDPRQPRLVRCAGGVQRKLP
jgi:uncharacterized membrane protein HdeD (DUF308 family)